MKAGQLEHELADFALGTQWGDLGAAERELAEVLLLDAIACAATGAVAVGRDAMEAAARTLGGAGEYVVIGGRPAGLSAAVMLNAWQVTATTMCDVYRERMCHVTPVVVPALLAALQRRPATREETLTTLLVAVEVTMRLCRAMEPGLFQGARWHAPGVIGPYGSATAFGRLSGLDIQRLREAWGAAGLQSAGTFAAIGSPGVKTTQARGAWAGVAAGVLAEQGHGGRDDHITHPHGGLFDAFGGADPDSVCDGIGRTWVAHTLSLRRWPASSSLQSVIEAALELRRQTDGRPLPERLVVRLPPRSYALGAEPGWRHQLEALQSARWVAGVVWTDGQCWLEQFGSQRLADEELGRLVLERVQVVEDGTIPDGGARLEATSPAGPVVVEVPVPRGWPARRLEADQVQDKLVAAIGQNRAEPLAGLVLGHSPWSVDTLMTLLAGARWQTR